MNPLFLLISLFLPLMVYGLARAIPRSTRAVLVRPALSSFDPRCPRSTRAVLVRPAPFAKSRYRAFRHFVTTFAHESALDSWTYSFAKSCKHDFANEYVHGRTVLFHNSIDPLKPQ